jgi:hypothetical protein
VPLDATGGVLAVLLNSLGCWSLPLCLASQFASDLRWSLSLRVASQFASDILCAWSLMSSFA